MAETITFSYTESGEDITVTLNENARGPAGADAAITEAAMETATGLLFNRHYGSESVVNRQTGGIISSQNTVAGSKTELSPDLTRLLKCTPSTGGSLSFSWTPTDVLDRVFTLPDASGAVVLDTAAQTLTNKTLTNPVFTTPTLGAAVINANIIPNLEDAWSIGDSTHYLTAVYSRNLYGVALTAGYSAAGPTVGNINLFSGVSNYYTQLTSPATDYRFIAFPDAGGTLALTSDITTGSNPTGITGADQITNIVSLTAAEYAAIGSPNASTLYVVI